MVHPSALSLRTITDSAANGAAELPAAVASRQARCSSRIDLDRFSVSKR
jgi:hypothetical protein